MRKLLCNAAEAFWHLLTAPLRQVVTEAVAEAIDCRLALLAVTPPVSQPGHASDREAFEEFERDLLDPVDLESDE